MSTSKNISQFLVSPKVFNKDLKYLYKKFKSKIFKTDDENNHDINAYAVGRVLRNYIVNALSIEGLFELIDRQKYISQGWQVYKFRYGVEKRSKRDGLRVFFAKNINDHVVILLYVMIKEDCPSEQILEEEIYSRLSEMLL